MSAHYAELDWQQTPMGELMLRRRRDPIVERDVFEVRLGDEFLMSSLFTVAEIELSRLGLAALPDRRLSVLVGGLGLGYTARAVLDDPRVVSLEVIEALEPVIDWHRHHLLPETDGLADDPRCALVHDDFFQLVRGPESGTGRFDAILVDIDHSPHHLLSSTHTDFYTPDGLRRVANLLQPGGSFALWSDDPPDAAFEAALADAFTQCETNVVTFANPLTRGESANTIYRGRRP